MINISDVPSSSELIEEFDSLNLNTLWSHEVYIAQDPVRMWCVIKKKIHPYNKYI